MLMERHMELMERHGTHMELTWNSWKDTVGYRDGVKGDDPIHDSCT